MQQDDDDGHSIEIHERRNCAKMVHNIQTPQRFQPRSTGHKPLLFEAENQVPILLLLISSAQTLSKLL